MVSILTFLRKLCEWFARYKPTESSELLLKEPRQLIGVGPMSTLVYATVTLIPKVGVAVGNVEWYKDGMEDLPYVGDG